MCFVHGAKLCRNSRARPYLCSRKPRIYAKISQNENRTIYSVVLVLKRRRHNDNNNNHHDHHHHRNLELRS
jgi:hypothetical protein